MTNEEIEKLEPSKERVMKQLDDLGVLDEHERDCFHKGVLFAKGFYKEDFDHLQALIENKNAYIENLEQKEQQAPDMDLLDWLNERVNDCIERVIDFDKSNMPLSKSNSEAMKHAYLNVIRQIELFTQTKKG